VGQEPFRSGGVRRRREVLHFHPVVEIVACVAGLTSDHGLSESPQPEVSDE